MSSKTNICNMAIAHLGSSQQIANLETERSNEARACKLFIDTVRKEVLRDFNWPFATKIATLGLIETTPNDEWGYSYRYPSDCVNFRRIVSGIRNETPDQKINYKIGRDTSGQLIFTDEADAVAEYTLNDTNYDIFPADVTIALSLKLATHIAPIITGGDPFKMGDRAAKFYDLMIKNAHSNALNEENTDQPQDSEFIRERE